MTSSSSSNNNNSLSLLAAAAFVAAPILYYQVVTKYKSKSNNNHDAESLLYLAKRRASMKPPFPKPVRDLLSHCRLAYLSTVDTDLASSHLSLMRFTYLQDIDDGEVVIMSTNTQTKKFEMLTKQTGVALLIHDFEQSSSCDNNGGGQQYSITLNGECRIVTDPTKAEYYRQQHLQHNPDYPQFIVGEHIAILCIDVKVARICNIHDQVTKWDVADVEHFNEEGKTASLRQ
jgi:hypothetical protein